MAESGRAGGWASPTPTTACGVQRRSPTPIPDHERDEPCREFVVLIDENGWRVTEQPVEIRYTDYSMSKGQPLLNGVNIVFDGLRGRMRR